MCVCAKVGANLVHYRHCQVQEWMLHKKFFQISEKKKWNISVFWRINFERSFFLVAFYNIFIFLKVFYSVWRSICISWRLNDSWSTCKHFQIFNNSIVSTRLSYLNLTFLGFRYKCQHSFGISDEDFNFQSE